MVELVVGVNSEVCLGKKMAPPGRKQKVEPVVGASGSGPKIIQQMVLGHALPRQTWISKNHFHTSI